MLDYIKIKVATKNVLWTLFMLDKLKYGKLIEPKTLRRYQCKTMPVRFASRNHSLVERTVSNCIKRKSMQSKELFACSTRNIKVRNKIFIHNVVKSYIFRNLEIWDQERIANIRLIWIAK